MSNSEDLDLSLVKKTYIKRKRTRMRLKAHQVMSWNNRKGRNMRKEANTLIRSKMKHKEDEAE